MKILTFTSLFPNREKPDFGIFIFQRVASLAQQPNNFVEVVAPVPYFPRWLGSQRWGAFSRIPVDEVFHNLRIHHPRYPMLPGASMRLHGWLMFRWSKALVKQLHEHYQFDCIDAHYVYPDGFAAILLGKLLKLPVMVTARGSDINSFSTMPTIRPMIRWTLRRATRVVAVSEALKDAMVKLRVPAEKISVIPNGVALERFKPVDPKQARMNLGLSLTNKIAVAVGSLTEGKNHALLIEAFARLAKSDPDAQLYVIGLGPLRDKLLQMVEHLGLSRSIFILGARPNEELQAWFSAADVSCLISSREGWPNVVMESLACGTPVLATRVGGVPEIIVSDQLGAFVDLNVDSIAAGLQSALARSWDREAIARQGGARDWNAVAREVDSVLQSGVSEYTAARPRATSGRSR